MKNKELLGDNIYLFPFNAEALIMYHILKQNGFHVEAFCDSAPERQGMVYQDCPVRPRVSGAEETVIICGHRLYIHAHLFEKSFKIEDFLEETDFAPAYAQIDRDFIYE